MNSVMGGDAVVFGRFCGLAKAVESRDDMALADLALDTSVTVLENSSDAVLVASYLAGSLDSLEALVRRHNQRLFRVARAICTDDATALDAVQEGYIKAIERLSQLRDYERFGAWLAQIVRNEALMRWRKFQRERVLDESSVAWGRYEGEERDRTPEKLTLQHELREVLAEAIEELPQEYREVFVLRAIEEMDTDEAATLLDIAPGTVKSRYFRAKSLLRSSIQEQYEPSLSSLYVIRGQICDDLTNFVMTYARRRS